MDEANIIRVGDLVRWDVGGVIKVGVVSCINPDGTCTMTLQGKNGENVTMRIRSERLDKIVSTVEAQTARGDAEEAEEEEAEEGSEDVEVTEIDETILTPEGIEERTTIVEEVLPRAPRHPAKKAVAKAPPAKKAQVPKALPVKKAPAKKAKAPKAPPAKKAKAKKTVKAKVRAKKSGRGKK